MKRNEKEPFQEEIAASPSLSLTIFTLSYHSVRAPLGHTLEDSHEGPINAEYLTD